MASEPEIMLPAHVQQPRYELSVQELVAQVSKIQQVMEHVMKKDTHYGVIPGTNKPSLYKPGAEVLCVTFRLRPEFESTEIWDGNHLTVKSRCILVHIPTGQVFGVGEGMCSTKESKYAYRGEGRTCPKCGVAAIKKSQYPPKNAPRGTEPGFYCHSKVGGCGANFAANDETITSQPSGRIANADLADCWNTVVKMSNKRSHVAATLLATAASDIFTQDVEDLPQFEQPQQQAAQAPIERPKGKPPEEQKEEVLSRIYGLLKKHKLMSKEAAEERSAALWHAFEVRAWEKVKDLDIQALRDGWSVLDAMLTHRSMPGDDSIPFGEDEPPPHEDGDK